MTIETVRAYYGKVLTGSGDLRTDACSTLEAPPAHIARALGLVHEEVTRRYYGCGLVIPNALDGLEVLDLGSGAGRDCYALSALVGERGSVLGIDATAEQLAVARAHIDWHTERYGYARPNVAFREGEIDKLGALGLESGRFDLVVSNCVINLVADKAAVFAEAHRLLKPGGELYFADVYADRRLDPALREDPVLLGECLAGALYWNDFLTLAKRSGFADPRLVADRPIAVKDPAMRARLGPARFFSATWRLFKIDGLEGACEDHGQAVRYRGSLPEAPDAFILDKHHVMETGRVFPVCGNSFRMIAETRFAPHFELYGDFSRHFGIFAGCGTNIPFTDGPDSPATAAGCC